MGEIDGASLITVITPTFNSSATLLRLYESLRQQTYRNFDWLIMDGDSTDETPRLVAEICRDSVWCSSSSRSDFGIYDALNGGIRMSRGEYYVVAGSDDFFEADALANYADAIKHNDVDVALARVIRGGKVIGGFRPSLGWLGHNKAFPGSHSVGMLFRKQLHGRFGLYSQRFPMLADGYFLKQLLRDGGVRFRSCDFVAGTFDESGISSTGKLQTLAETWQIQMMTEKNTALQMFLFAGKMLVRHTKVRRELADRAAR